MKQITVITSVYNKGERTRRTIEGILGQTFSDFDYLLVNDESTDETGEICCSYDDPRIIYREQSNRGFTRTMREAVAQVKTPFVAIQGAGDESLPDRLAIQLDFLNQNPDVGFVGCNYSNRLGDGSLIRATDLPFLRFKGPESLLERNRVSQGEVMFRVSAYEKAGGYRDFFRYSQDWDLWLRMLKYSDLVRLPENLYARYIDPETDVTGNPQKTAEQSILGSFAQYLAEGDLNGLWVNEELKPNEHYDAFLGNLGLSERRKVARKAAFQVWKLRGKGLSEQNRVLQALQISREYAPKSFFSRELAMRNFIWNVSPKLYSLYSNKSKKILFRLAQIGES